jgi:hypothetical protein
LPPPSRTVRPAGALCLESLARCNHR